VNPEDFDAVLIVGRPETIPDHWPDLPVPDPHPGSVLLPCDRCHLPTYVGPAQQAEIVKLSMSTTPYVILCFLDAALAGDRTEDVTVVSALTNKTTPLRKRP
jgi:hypothetical protein